MVLPSLKIETALWQKGYEYIVGMDEVGRGSWAGPLVVAGVILPTNFKIPEGLADSKLVKPEKRRELSKIIKEIALGTKIVEIAPKIIDKIGIGKATNLAFKRIAKSIRPIPDFCLIDAFYIKYFSRKKQMAVKNGDKICASISAASVVAKVHRDNLMKKLHRRHPNYGFGKHKGYGTASHQQAIIRFGLSNIHRLSYNLGFASR